MVGNFYLPPRAEVSQGDIYENTPSLEVVSRPLRVARPWPKPLKDPAFDAYQAYSEDGPPPQERFHWSLDPPKGQSRAKVSENLIAPGHRGLAMLMTHDCEVDSGDDFRLMAMIRPLDAIDPRHRADAVGLAIWPYFPLAGQEENPTMAPCFVDFRRITTVHVSALRPEDRYASLDQVVRDALGLRFWMFLFRRILGPGEVDR